MQCKTTKGCRNGKIFFRKIINKFSIWKTFWYFENFKILKISKIKIFLENFAINIPYWKFWFLQYLSLSCNKKVRSAGALRTWNLIDLWRYCQMLVFSVDSTASSMSSGRLQKKSMPVLLSNSSMVIMQLGKVIELHELLICSVQ